MLKKKILGIAVILGITAISFTNAYTQNYNCYNSYAGTGFCYELQPNESFVMGNYTNKITNSFGFNNGEGQIFLQAGNSNHYTSVFWSGGKIRSFSNINNRATIGELQNVCVYNGTDNEEIINYCFMPKSNQPNYENNYLYYTTTYEQMIQTFDNQTMTKVIYTNKCNLTDPETCDKYLICGIYENIGKTLCITSYPYDNGNSYLSNIYGGPQYVRDVGYSTNSVILAYGNSITNSPLTPGQNNGGGNGSDINTNITEYACPTIQQLINTYGTDYTENLCYSSSLIYSGGTIQQITPKTIFELYPTYTGFTADISTFNTYCRSPNTTQACQTAFNGKDIEYTLLAKIPDNIKKLNLYQYCNLQLNYPDKNATTCTTNTGTIPGLDNPNITINDIITEIGNEDYTVITPGRPPETTGTGNGSGSVYDGILGDNEDDTERWNVIQNAKNIVQTMKELYAKFTGIFRAREGTSGFIPEYITGILLLIILFKLFKK